MPQFLNRRFRNYLCKVILDHLRLAVGIRKSEASTHNSYDCLYDIFTLKGSEFLENRDLALSAFIPRMLSMMSQSSI